MASDWMTSVLLVLVLAAIVGAARVTSRSWFAPGPFFGAYWLLMTGAPLVFAPDFYVDAGAVGWIVLSVAVLAAGGLLGQSLGRRGRPVPVVVGPRALRPLRLAVVVTGVLGLGVIVVHLKTFGFSLAVFMSLADLMQAGRTFSVARYSSGYSGPLLARILLVPLYLATPLGGILASFARSRRDRWLSLLPFLPALGVLAILTTKATLIMSIAFWLAGLIAGSVIQRRSLNDVLSIRAISRITAAMFAVFALFVGTSMARYGWSEGAQALRVVDRLRTYALGHLGGFSRWFESDYWHTAKPALGEKSIGGVFEVLGFSERVQGIYQNFAMLGPDRYTNIYTFYRGMIEDFTMPGSLLVMMVVGMIGGIVYEKSLRGYGEYLGLILLFYGITICGFTVSVLNYNSYVLVSLVLVFGVWIFAHRLRMTLVMEARALRGTTSRIAGGHQPRPTAH